MPDRKFQITGPICWKDLSRRVLLPISERRRSEFSAAERRKWGEQGWSNSERYGGAVPETMWKQWDAVDAEINVPSVENTKLAAVLFFLGFDYVTIQPWMLHRPPRMLSCFCFPISFSFICPLKSFLAMKWRVTRVNRPFLVTWWTVAIFRNLFRWCTLRRHLWACISLHVTVMPTFFQTLQALNTPQP